MEGHGRPIPAVKRDRLTFGAALERFVRVAPVSTLALLGAGLVLSGLTVLTWIWRTPFGFSSFPVWVIFAINAGVSLAGGLMQMAGSGPRVRARARRAGR